MLLFAGVMKTLRPLWTLVLRNTFPSRLTGSFGTGDNVLIFLLRRGIAPPMIRAFKLHIEMCSPSAYGSIIRLDQENRYRNSAS